MGSSVVSVEVYQIFWCWFGTVNALSISYDFNHLVLECTLMEPPNETPDVLTCALFGQSAVSGLLEIFSQSEPTIVPLAYSPGLQPTFSSGKSCVIR